METQFFFTSVASIFDYFTPEQIGCGKHRLYDLGAAKGRRVETSKCTVTRLKVLTSRGTITIRHIAQDKSGADD